MLNYDIDYAETLRLDDGTTADLRLVRPEDAPLLQAGFAALSPETRYLRFFAHKRSLTTEEAERLSRLDGHRDLAVGAIGASSSAFGGLPMGVARFARARDGTTEAAIVVVDAFQGRGLGRVLLERLAAAARERGIPSLRFTALAGNVPLVRLVRRVFPDAESYGAEGGIVTLVARLGGPLPRSGLPLLGAALRGTGARLRASRGS